jgi:hypothetical protein
VQWAVKHFRVDSKSHSASKPRDGRGLLAFYFAAPPASCVEIDLPPVAATMAPVPFLEVVSIESRYSAGASRYQSPVGSPEIVGIGGVG